VTEQGVVGVLDPAVVRVTVASASRRVDLVLPARVPVAELVPPLARSVGLLDAATVHGGYRLLSTSGVLLVPEVGLAAQGVTDGEVLTVAAGDSVPAPHVYDDVVEAMAEVVEQDLASLSTADRRGAALCGAGVAMGVGAVALLAQPGSAAAASAAGLVSAVLAAATVVLSARERDPPAALTMGCMAVGYAAVSGLLLPQQGNPYGGPVAAGGLGALLVGLTLLLGLRRSRPVLLAPVVVGATFGVAGLAADRWSWHADVVLTCAMTFLVLAGDAYPWLALGMTSTDVAPLDGKEDVGADPAGVDIRQVREDARTAHDVLVGTSLTTGAMAVLVAPLAASLGWAGSIVALLCCLLLMLRTRRLRSASEVLVGLASGVLGLACVAATVTWQHPAWRPAVALASTAAGLVVLATTLLLPPRSLRRERLGDLVENAAVLCLLPLLVVASGLFDLARTGR
jgi:type VII secretion integral membrane protein EccD